MLVLVEEEKRTRPTPPPDPPEGGKGGGELFTFLSYYIQLAQPHMLRVPHFLESFGARAGGIEKNAQEFKGTYKCILF
jgi:hypothetical protein